LLFFVKIKKRLIDVLGYFPLGLALPFDEIVLKDGDVNFLEKNMKKKDWNYLLGLREKKNLFIKPFTLNRFVVVLKKFVKSFNF